MDTGNKFTIGEIARLTGLTIRTLQYYDNTGLVPLEKDCRNGRRFFKESDLSRLQQVMFYKAMGLKIKKIKELLTDTVTVNQFISVLIEQKDLLTGKLNDLSANIAIIEASLASLKENGSVPWGNLIELIISLNKETIFEYRKVPLDAASENAFKDHYSSADTIIKDYWEWKKLVLEAVSHTLNKIDPAGAKGREFARKWENMIYTVSDGNNELLEAHRKSYNNRKNWPDEDRRLMEFADSFIDQAIDNYEKNMN